VIQERGIFRDQKGGRRIKKKKEERAERAENKKAKSGGKKEKSQEWSGVQFFELYSERGKKSVLEREGGQGREWDESKKQQRGNREIHLQEPARHRQRQRSIDARKKGDVKKKKFDPEKRGKENERGDIKSTTRGLLHQTTVLKEDLRKGMWKQQRKLEGKKKRGGRIGGKRVGPGETGRNGQQSGDPFKGDVLKTAAREGKNAKRRGKKRGTEEEKDGGGFERKGREKGDME